MSRKNDDSDAVDLPEEYEEEETVEDPDYEETEAAVAAEDDEAEPAEDAVIYTADEEGAPMRVDPVRVLRVITGSVRRTGDTLTHLECANILGIRAVHLDKGAPAYVDSSAYSNNREVAYYELLARRMPFKIHRQVGPEEVEEWRIAEMKLPKLPPVDKLL